ncbi:MULTISPECIES: DUF3152 domain-containing protein [unclassified Micromonospora]|uniref:DUF3152 domain-containing protein n=1 Tax=unclassified Micromonospora TaxID=2617518 RepID=UPI0033221667
MTSSSPCDPPGPPNRRSSPSPNLHPSPSPPPSPPPSPSPSPRPRGRRWSGLFRDRRLIGLGLALLLAAAVVVTLAPRPDGQAGEPPTGDPGRAAYGAAAGEHERPTVRPQEDTGHPQEDTGHPREGTGSFVAASGESPVRGVDGPVRRYRVAVESGAGQDVAAFAATVDEVLGDPRGWTASGEFRVQRVAEADDADFTVYLATPDTSERMCAEGGLSTEGYTSCRLPGQVIINLARWLEAVPDYGAPLEIYRTYVVNHEVGHEFGEEHQTCPAPGEPAPVMQQQTYGLDGCVANAWPYVDGSRYEGELAPGI